jgi:hypothetical protein
MLGVPSVFQYAQAATDAVAGRNSLPGARGSGVRREHLLRQV